VEADTINLDGGIYNLTAVAEENDDGPNGLPSITTAITIVGNRSFVRRDPTLGEFSGPEFRIVHVGETGNLSLDNLVIGGGFLGGSDDSGPGLFNRGTTNITNSIITQNITIFGGGGGIQNVGTVTVADSLIADNVAGEGPGGGVASIGITNIINSTIANNSADGSGGGIDNAGYLTILDSTITGNRTDLGIGGGILNLNDGVLIVSNSTVANNRADWGV
jgi:hypothetical protein